MDYYYGTPIAYHLMAKPHGSICNLDCNYCFYLEKEKLYSDRKPSEFKMSTTVLHEFIQQYMDSQNAPVVSFTWQGGEPALAGLDFYKEVVEVQNYYANGRKVINAFQTNGTLLKDDEWFEFFAKHNFLLGISIDGPEHLHNQYRKSKSGANTWVQVMETIGKLHHSGVEFNTLTTVNAQNASHPKEVYEFLKSIGSTFLQFIPVVEIIAQGAQNNELSLVSPDYKGESKVSEWSVSPLGYGTFLTGVFDEWVKQDVGKTYVQMFDVTLANYMGKDPGLCVYNKTCGTALALEHNGDIYSCDHFVYPENKLGNLLSTPLQTLVTSSQQVTFGQNKFNTLPQKCKECQFLNLCYGECPKNRILKTPKGEAGLNYFCEGLTHYFNHTKPYFEFMVNELNNERPPANVMKWVAKTRK
jgi:uncharacterized protein